MTTTPAHLSSRAVIAVSGPEARGFLQRVLTCDLDTVAVKAWTPGALLTPQGKIVADFLITADAAGLLIDVHAGAAEALVKRLSLYRLRADAKVEPRPDLAIVSGAGCADPRSSRLPQRAVRPAAEAGLHPEGDSAQDALEIAAGVAAFGRDYGEAEVFPTEVNLDLYGGVGWKKGCFIGQEVLSRMKRRGNIRKRSLAVAAEGGAPEPGADLFAGDASIGRISSASGDRAIALTRLDRFEAARDSGAPILAGGKRVRIERPEWLEGL